MRSAGELRGEGAWRLRSRKRFMRTTLQRRPSSRRDWHAP